MILFFAAGAIWANTHSLNALFTYKIGPFFAFSISIPNIIISIVTAGICRITYTIVNVQNKTDFCA